MAFTSLALGEKLVLAEKLLLLALKQRPNDGYIIDSVGWVYFKMGQIDKAVAYLEKAAYLQTSDWAINDHLGDAYWVSGRKNEARYQWQHSLTLNPSERQAQTIKKKINGQYDEVVGNRSR